VLSQWFIEAQDVLVPCSCFGLQTGSFGGAAQDVLSGLGGTRRVRPPTVECQDGMCYQTRFCTPQQWLGGSCSSVFARGWYVRAAVRMQPWGRNYMRWEVAWVACLGAFP
jgi:hypothetical protein